MSARTLLRRTRILAGVALALALLALLAWLIALNWRPSTTAFPIQGVDVGEAQGAIDWRRIAADGEVGFAYVRATLGADRQDSHFATNWDALYEAGISRGAIHVFSLCQLAADQAGNLYRHVPHATEDLPIALELRFEPDCPARPDREVLLIEIRRFLAGIEAQTGRRAILKISRAFEERYRISGAVQRLLWSEQPFLPPSYFDKPWTIWQATRLRRIEGVAGPVNWDVMTR